MPLIGNVADIYLAICVKIPRINAKEIVSDGCKVIYCTVFNEAMSTMKKLKPEAYEWLEKISYHLWARHAFPIDLKNNYITNNLAES